MSAKFRRAPTRRPASESPERLFDELNGTPAGVPSLWAHQADVLRKYHDEHVSTPDLALELPTGSGKTLPALLIAEWRRTSLGQRAVYACPTTQLANQVFSAALREGISAVALHGRAVEWDTADAAKYDRSDAVAISTYSTIFNSSPKLSVPGTLIFDDAHAGEQFVAQAWSVAVSEPTSQRSIEPCSMRSALSSPRFWCGASSRQILIPRPAAMWGSSRFQRCKVACHTSTRSSPPNKAI